MARIKVHELTKKSKTKLLAQLKDKSPNKPNNALPQIKGGFSGSRTITTDGRIDDEEFAAMIRKDAEGFGGEEP
ncbi:unnamed protein product [Dovyalis caffra]|uniref:Uncharacterized protein n=1 Tax=Dovyalis caffra TaxID=77055 RepID=A0AAV1QRB3_9ROSI|nr:unnamed protein product [Dovyalis caffra]